MADRLIEALLLRLAYWVMDQRNERCFVKDDWIISEADAAKILSTVVQWWDPHTHTRTRGGGGGGGGYIRLFTQKDYAQFQKSLSGRNWISETLLWKTLVDQCARCKAKCWQPGHFPLIALVVLPQLFWRIFSFRAHSLDCCCCGYDCCCCFWRL